MQILRGALPFVKAPSGHSTNFEKLKRKAPLTSYSSEPPFCGITVAIIKNKTVTVRIGRRNPYLSVDARIASTFGFISRELVSPPSPHDSRPPELEAPPQTRRLFQVPRWKRECGLRAVRRDLG